MITVLTDLTHMINPMLQAWKSWTKHYNWNQAAATTTTDRSNKYQKPRSHLQDCKTFLQVVGAKQNRVFLQPDAARYYGRAISSNKKIKRCAIERRSRCGTKEGKDRSQQRQQRQQQQRTTREEEKREGWTHQKGAWSSTKTKKCR